MSAYKIVAIDIKSQGVRYEILLNGGLVVRELDPAQKITGSKLNPLLVEGDNDLEIALAPPAGEDAPALDAHFVVTVMEGEHGKTPGPEGMLLEYGWVSSDAPVQGPGFTRVKEAKLPTSVSHGRWAWEDATPFTDADRPAVAALAQRLHAAFAANDVAAIEALNALRYDEVARALDVPAAELALHLREGTQEMFAAPDFRMEPFASRVLVMDPRADGRLVEVTSPEPPDGAPGPALFGVANKRPVPISVTVSHLSGGWTIVR